MIELDNEAGWIQCCNGVRDRQISFATATEPQIHDFDIVHGPIANDDVGYQIRRLLAGMITIETFLEELKYKEGITYQYFFATERSVQFLKKL